jgi:hypothetical protein
MNRLCLFLAPILTGLACGVIVLERPSGGGLGDPSLYLRYAVPGTHKRWVIPQARLADYHEGRIV